MALELTPQQKVAFERSVEWRGSKGDLVMDLYPLIRDMVLEVAEQQIVDDGNPALARERIRAMKGTP